MTYTKTTLLATAIIVLTYLFCPVIIYAQDNNGSQLVKSSYEQITGQVLDEFGGPLPGAKVVLAMKDGETLKIPSVV